MPMATPKPVEFRGSAPEDLRAFPDAARREAGYQLEVVCADTAPLQALRRGENFEALILIPD